MAQAPARRRVLYVNPLPACHALFPILRGAGWEPVSITGPDQIRKPSQLSDCAVGIVRLNELADVARLSYIDGMLHQRDREWVALMPKDLAEAPQVRRLISECFFDFHTLPPDPSRVLATLGHAYGMAMLKRQELGQATQPAEEQMVGCSAVMLGLFRDIRKVAQAEAAVLITGESGSGKELTAKAIHERSGRAPAPFVAINCSAIPSNLIQSELFGYEKGAFTGAAQRKIGRIEAAAGGTVFLDEIGDLPLELQTNLLRFLQEKQIERVGGQQPVHVDVRVLAATHVDLEKAVAAQRFREDLYHRLNVLRVRVPSLRERPGDIEVLARYFFQQFAREGHRALRGFSREALETLNNYDWPGNVRELINRVRRAVVMSEGRLITTADLGFEPMHTSRRVATLDEAREEAERQTLLAALQRFPGNITRAARELGISRVTLYRLLDKHGIKSSAPDSPAPATAPLTKWA